MNHPAPPDGRTCHACQVDEALREACLGLAAAIRPAVTAAASAADAAFAADAARAAAYAADAALAARAGDSPSAVAFAVDAMGAVGAVAAVARAAAFEADLREKEARAASAMDAARVAVTLVQWAPLSHAAGFMSEAADTAAGALLEAELVFTTLAGNLPRPCVVADMTRTPGVLTRRLLTAACALLPAGDRGRYAEEWLSLLTELPNRRARAGHVLSILSGTPRQAWTLRRPRKPAPPA